MDDHPEEVGPQLTVKKIFYLFIHSLKKVFTACPLNAKYLTVAKCTEIVKVQKKTKLTFIECANHLKHLIQCNSPKAMY